MKYSSPKFRVHPAVSSVVILTCLFFILTFHSPDNLICKALISVVFIGIGMGNTVFGFLKNPTLKFLGEISYSTYLLHGIILFTVIYFGIGIENAKQFTAWQYCLLIFTITPCVVFFSFLGYRFVEKPFMDISKNKRAKERAIKKASEAKSLAKSY